MALSLPRPCPRPTVSLLDQELGSLSWRDVKGMALHLDDYMTPRRLDRIEYTYRTASECKRAAMSVWLNGDTAASWYKVVYALRKVSMDTLASQIESKYCNSRALAQRVDSFESYPRDMETSEKMESSTVFRSHPISVSLVPTFMPASAAQLATTQGITTEHTLGYDRVHSNLHKILSSLKAIRGARRALTMEFKRRRWVSMMDNPTEDELLNIVLMRIKQDSSQYDVFLTMLRKIKGMDQIVEMLCDRGQQPPVSLVPTFMPASAAQLATTQGITTVLGPGQQPPVSLVSTPLPASAAQLATTQGITTEHTLGYDRVRSNRISIIRLLKAKPDAHEALTMEFKRRRWVSMMDNPTEDELLNVVLMRIKQDSSQYDVFLTMLRNIKGMDLIVKQLCDHGQSTSVPLVLSARVRPPTATTEEITTEGNSPSMPEMLRLKVPQGIAHVFPMFGTILLNDKMGDKMKAIRASGGDEDIVRMILQEWIQGHGKPVTWKTLISTLRVCEVFDLAAEIEATKTDVKVPAERDLAEDLVSVIPHGKMIPLGVQLGLPWNKVKQARWRRDSFYQLMTMLNEWKKAGTTEYTWETLITALRSPSVGLVDLAEELRHKYCS